MMVSPALFVLKRWPKWAEMIHMFEKIDELQECTIIFPLNDVKPPELW